MPDAAATLSPPAPGPALPARPMPLPGATLEGQGSFQGILGRALAHGPSRRLSPEEGARSAAEEAVAAIFIQPILKQLRDSDHTPAPFGPSQAEKQFHALRDAELAQRIAHAQRFPLVDRMARDLLARARGAGPGTAPDAAPPPDPAHTHEDRHPRNPD